MSRTPEPSHHTDADLPSAGVRTLLSFLLFVHLFALCVAIASNARPLSGLRNQLGYLPLVRPYLQLLHMDLAYNFHLTYALAEDTDPWIEIVPESDAPRDPSAQPEEASTPAMTFPQRGLEPNVRNNRYRNLMLTSFLLAQNEVSEGLLPKRIAARMMHENGIDSGTYRLSLERRDLLSPEEASRGVDPYAAREYPVYEAELWFSRDGLEMNKIVSTLETATVREKSATDGNDRSPHQDQAGPSNGEQ